MACILNPSLPYRFALSKPAAVGTILRLTGSICEDAEKIAVNFLTADNDIALHFNPRFKDDAVVMNSRTAGDWACEERLTCLAGLERGKTFTLTMLIENDMFMVGLNGQHYCHFAHRLPKEAITSVEVLGEAELSSIVEGSAFSSAGPIISPPTPYTAFIPGGFVDNKMLLVIGETTGDEFSVNIQCGHEPFKHVALHVKAQLNGDKLVLNECADGCWGAEQVHEGVTITRGKAFVLEVVSHDQQFEVRVNGTEVGHFQHRHADDMPLHCCDAVYISGDVKVHLLRV